MQKTDFSIEILIHDDASTDGTDDIIREYTAKYPNLIFPLFETENQYSKGHAGEMDIKYNYSRARGKYIAYCEGDDYWTDPYKLQKQVDFMEANPDCSVCFTRTKHLQFSTGMLSDDNCGDLFKNNIDKFEITRELFFQKWYTQPLSMMFRKENYCFKWQKKYKYYRDSHEIYHLLNQGKGWVLNFYSGIYVRQEYGIHSLLSEYKQSEVAFNIAQELSHSFNDHATKSNLKQIASWYFNQSVQISKHEALMLLIKQPNTFVPIMVHYLAGILKKMLKRRL